MIPPQDAGLRLRVPLSRTLLLLICLLLLINRFINFFLLLIIIVNALLLIIVYVWISPQDAGLRLRLPLRRRFRPPCPGLHFNAPHAGAGVAVLHSLLPQGGDEVNKPCARSLSRNFPIPLHFIVWFHFQKRRIVKVFVNFWQQVFLG